MAIETLTNRQLNRATLTRQMLLERSDMAIVAAIEHLIGLQGQVSEGPYQALWSRLTGFRHGALTDLIVERTLVRATSFRATLHLHTVADLVGIRPLVQPTLDRMWQSAFGNRRFGDNSIAAVHRAGARLLDHGPLTGSKLGAALQAQFPNGEPLAKSVLLQVKEILVQIPPTRIWGSGHAPILTRIENWVAPPPPALRRENLVLRYLRAFGPASILDMQAWSGIARLSEAVAAVASQLISFAAADGRVLYDLPDAPRPDADVVAPVRFLPDFDNVLLGYGERSRLVTADDLKRLSATRSFRAVLVDGTVAAHWSIKAPKTSATLTVSPFRRLTKREVRAIETEGLAFLGFMRPKADDLDVDVEPAS